MTTPQSTEKLPFFVYGTLLRGEANHHFVRAAARKIEPATLRGARIFDLGPYPMALETGETSDSMRGELVWIFAARFERVLARLDKLEGVRADDPASRATLFRREIREAQLLDSSSGSPLSVRCHVYFGREDLALRARRVPMNCWRTRFDSAF